MNVMNEWGVIILKSNADININYDMAVLEPAAWYWKPKPCKSFAWILLIYLEVALIIIDQDIVGCVSLTIQFYDPFYVQTYSRPPQNIHLISTKIINEGQYYIKCIH